MSRTGGDRHPLAFLDQGIHPRTAPPDRSGPDARPNADPPPPKGGRTQDRPDAYQERQLEATWAELERLGRLTGHVVTRCPSCSSRAMTSIVNTSGTSRWVKSGGGWPKCKQCLAAPRVEPVGDVTLVARVRPGQMATKREVSRYKKVLSSRKEAGS